MSKKTPKIVLEIPNTMDKSIAGDFTFTIKPATAVRPATMSLVASPAANPATAVGSSSAAESSAMAENRASASTVQPSLDDIRKRKLVEEARRVCAPAVPNELAETNQTREQTEAFVKNFDAAQQGGKSLSVNDDFYRGLVADLRNRQAENGSEQAEKESADSEREGEKESMGEEVMREKSWWNCGCLGSL